MASYGSANAHTEFLLISLWDRLMQSVSVSGQTLRRRCVFPSTKNFSVEVESNVIHYEVSVKSHNLGDSADETQCLF